MKDGIDTWDSNAKGLKETKLLEDMVEIPNLQNQTFRYVHLYISLFFSQFNLGFLLLVAGSSLSDTVIYKGCFSIFNCQSHQLISNSQERLFV